MDATEVKILTQNYRTVGRWLEKGLILTERTHVYPSACQIEGFSSNWSLGWVNETSGRVFIRSSLTWIPVNGPTMLFLPPFSIVEFRVIPGQELHWTLFSSTDPLPFKADQMALVPASENLPKTKSEVYDWIQRTQEQGISIQEGREPSAIAIRLKKWIIKNLRDSARVDEAAHEFGYSRVVLSRAFKESYGLSPVEYRHRLRLFEAMAEMNRGLSITEALFEVGYNDPSQFITQFRKYLGVTPKHYRLPS